jgi:hypothetical protein
MALERGQLIADLLDRTVAAGVPALFDVCDLIDAASDTGRRNLRMLRALTG